MNISRIEIPTSELNHLIQPKKHGVLNSIYVKSPESKQLQELPFTRDGPMTPISDLAELQDDLMILEPQRLTNDLSSQIPSFVSSPLSPSKSKIVVKSPSRSLLIALENSSESNLNKKSNGCLKRRCEPYSDTLTPSKQTEIEVVKILQIFLKLNTLIKKKY